MFLQVGGPVVRSRWGRQRIARVLHASCAVRVGHLTAHLGTLSHSPIWYCQRAETLGKTGTGCTIGLCRMASKSEVLTDGGKPDEWILEPCTEKTRVHALSIGHISGSAGEY